MVDLGNTYILIVWNANWYETIAGNYGTNFK